MKLRQQNIREKKIKPFFMLSKTAPRAARVHIGQKQLQLFGCGWSRRAAAKFNSIMFVELIKFELLFMWLELCLCVYVCVY